MILDKENIFADNLDVKASGRVVSTTIDHLVAGDAKARELVLRVQVTAAFTRAAGALNTEFSLETHTSDSFTSARTVLWRSGSLAKATLIAGYIVATVKVPVGALRYINLVTTNDAAADAANIDAFLTPDAQNNNL